MAQSFRIINLEDGHPTVEQATKRLLLELQLARSQKVKVLKIIHGFGSSGKGGKIRPATRSRLAALQQKKQIRFFIAGEQFSIFDADTRKVLDACPHLRKDNDLERHNNGITFVVLG